MPLFFLKHSIHSYGLTATALFLFSFAWTRVPPQTSVAFLFDDHRIHEEHDRVKMHPYGVLLVEDRFGNDRSAVGLNGNANSYLNLGISPLLKPRSGTFSVWVSITSRLYSGKGAIGMPVLLTKNSTSNDWYESVAIYFIGEDRQFHTVCGKDSLNNAGIKSMKHIEYGRWYHLAVVMEDHLLSFYVDGDLQGSIHKDFETVYLPTDSLMMGHTANAKNVRFILGAVDDIRIFHRGLSASEIKALYEAPDPNRARTTFRQVIFWGGVVAGVVLVSFGLVWQRRRQLKRTGERLDLQRRLHEMEIRTLKAQMNPHFIFNALNSIQVFIMNMENEKAEMYLSKFSKLLRELLESNANESLSIAEEAGILNGYLEIESLRFGQSFTYNLTIDSSIDQKGTSIPHMLIQPFVENAIWHGLLKKKGDRRLEIGFFYDSGQTVRCVVDDNGTGRKQTAAREDTFKKRSLALSMVRQRLELMNLLLHIECKVEITDKEDATGNSLGTCVELILPVLPINGEKHP